MDQSIDVQLRVGAVAKIAGISKPSIYRLMKLGMFPRPRRVGLAAVAWSSKEIVEWLASRETA